MKLPEFRHVQQQLQANAWGLSVMRAWNLRRPHRRYTQLYHGP